MKNLTLFKRRLRIVVWFCLLNVLLSTHAADSNGNNSQEDLSKLGRDPSVCQDPGIKSRESRTNTTARLFDTVATGTPEGRLGRYLETNGFVEHPGVCLKAPGIVLFIYNNRLHEAVLVANGSSTGNSDWKSTELEKLRQSTSGPRVGNETKLPMLFKLNVSMQAPSNKNYNGLGYGLNPQQPPNHRSVQTEEYFFRLAKWWGWGKKTPFDPKKLSADSTWIILYGNEDGEHKAIRSAALWNKGKISAKIDEAFGEVLLSSLNQLSDGDYGNPIYMLKLEHPENLPKKAPDAYTNNRKILTNVVADSNASSAFKFALDVCLEIISQYASEESDPFIKQLLNNVSAVSIPITIHPLLPGDPSTLGGYTNPSSTGTPVNIHWNSDVHGHYEEDGADKLPCSCLLHELTHAQEFFNLSPEAVKDKWEGNSVPAENWLLWKLGNKKQRINYSGTPLPQDLVVWPQAGQ